MQHAAAASRGVVALCHELSIGTFGAMITFCAFVDQFVRCQLASLDACTVQAFVFGGFAAYVAPTTSTINATAAASTALCWLLQLRG